MTNPFDTENRLEDYPDDDRKERRQLVVRNHFIYSDRVVITLLSSDGKRETDSIIILASELKRAVDNAVRAHR